jgi:formate dehydrogenase subunit gamma
VRHSLPHWRDAVWLLKGGGLIARSVHPPARKFNAGQKLLFWLTAVCGLLLAISGMVLQAPSMAASLLDGLSPALPGWLRAEMAADGTTHAVQWHGALALALTCAVIVHIYFRTVGIQGAASAMISGEVDANWARQHHSLWAEPEVERIEADAGDTVAARTP